MALFFELCTKYVPVQRVVWFGYHNKCRGQWELFEWQSNVSGKQLSMSCNNAG